MGVSIAYLPKLYLRCYYRGVSVVSKLKDRIFNAKNRKSGEMENRLFETYKNSVLTHVNHMFPTAYDIAMATMFAYL